MQPDDKGKFCGSCSKSVFDFSNKTDLEINDILTANKGQKVCGHFKKTQINRPLNIQIDLNNLPQNMSSTKTFAIALFLVFGTLLFSCTNAQNQKVGEIEIVNTMPEKDVLGQMVMPIETLRGDTIMEPDSLVSTICNKQDYVDGGISIDEIAVVVQPILPLEHVVGMMMYIEPTLTDSAEVIPTDTTIIEKPTKLVEEPIIDTKTKLVIYPNPSKGEFTIKYDVLKRADVRVDILDLKGALLKTLVNVNQQFEGKYNIPVNLNELPNGIYIVSMINNGKKFTEKVVIDK